MTNDALYEGYPKLSKNVPGAAGRTMYASRQFKVSKKLLAVVNDAAAADFSIWMSMG